MAESVNYKSTGIQQKVKSSSPKKNSIDTMSFFICTYMAYSFNAMLDLTITDYGSRAGIRGILLYRQTISDSQNHLPDMNSSGEKTPVIGQSGVF